MYAIKKSYTYSFIPIVFGICTFLRRLLSEHVPRLISEYLKVESKIQLRHLASCTRLRKFVQAGASPKKTLNRSNMLHDYDFFP